MATFTEEFRAVVQKFLLVSITVSSFSYKRNKHFLEMFEYGGTHLKTVHFKLEHTHFLKRPLPAYIYILYIYILYIYILYIYIYVHIYIYMDELDLVYLPYNKKVILKTSIDKATHRVNKMYIH